jgi:hypothetical protein
MIHSGNRVESPAQWLAYLRRSLSAFQLRAGSTDCALRQAASWRNRTGTPMAMSVAARLGVTKLHLKAAVCLSCDVSRAPIHILRVNSALLDVRQAMLDWRLPDPQRTLSQRGSAPNSLPASLITLR